jgi:chemotaxis protein CheD
MMSSRPDNTHSELPRALVGFESINRYWDTSNNIYAAKLLPGEFYVSMNGELITTVLGSCISACIRDTKTGIGGMNHFMLPIDISSDGKSWKNTPVNAQTRYGNIAMERLINVILAGGGKRENLEIKLFGGGKVLQIDTDIGNKNIDFVKRYLETEGFSVAAEDVGGDRPRKVQYYPTTGRARVKKLNSLHNDTLKKRETSYIKTINNSPIEGRIDLF